MARSVTFNGIVRFRPGGIVKVNAEALNQVLASANSVVGLVGEAEGGQPGVLHEISDPTGASELFRSGPLADAIRLAFQSSGDPDIVGGASTVFAYKTNASTQATLSLPTDTATLKLTSTATGGGATTLIDAARTEADDYFNGMWIVLRPHTATTEVRQVTDYTGGTDTYTVGMAWTVNPAGADAYRVYQDEVFLMAEIDNATATTTSLPLISTTMVASEHIGRWAYVFVDSTTAVLRKITANTTTTLTVSPALPSVPVAGAFLQILPNAINFTSADYGAHTNGVALDVGAGVLSGSLVLTSILEGVSEISPDVGGKPVLKLLYRGGANAISDTVAASSTTTLINLVTGGLTPSAHIGTQVLIGSEYTTITANTASSLTVSPALSDAPAAATAVGIRTVTAGTARILGSAGVATSLTSSLTGVAGDNLSITFSAGQTLRSLMNAINANVNYLASAGPGVNADTALVADFDFGPSTETSVLNSPNIATNGLMQNVMDMVRFVNESSSRVTAARASTGAYAGCRKLGVVGDPVSLSGGTRGISSNTTFQNGFDALLLERVNSVIPLIDQNLANEGYSSTATLASVAAQLKDHVAQCRGAAASERGGYIGSRGTKTAVISLANSLNDTDVQLVAQNPSALDSTGTLQEFGPRMLAVMAASMRAGVPEVGEPLTHKYLRVSGLTQDSSWDPADTTDANDLIENGVLFAESVAAGTRWVRDITTHVQDDNLAYMEGSVRDVVRYVAYNLRTELENRYTGRKAAPATIASVKNTVATLLEVYRQNNIIVDSTDPATGARIKAYHNIKVTSSGDILNVSVGIFPVPGINFELIEIFLSLPTQAA